MKTVLVNYRVNPLMESTTTIRKARKVHACSGGHNGERNTACDRPIEAGSVYVEYHGESYAYQSGQRFHPECAEQQGITEKLK